jgi:hypothetical protein
MEARVQAISPSLKPSPTCVAFQQGSCSTRSVIHQWQFLQDMQMHWRAAALTDVASRNFVMYS